MVIEGTVSADSGPLTMIACVADGLLFRAEASPPTYVLCDDTCQDLHATGAPDMSAVVPIGGKLVAVASHGGVLAVWRDGAPTFYGLPEAMRLVHQREWPLVALTDGKSLDVLAREPDRLLRHPRASEVAQLARLDHVVLDRAVGPPAVAADRVDALRARAAPSSRAVSASERLRDVHVRRIHHDVVLGDELVIGDDAARAQVGEHARAQRRRRRTSRRRGAPIST